MPAVRRDSAQMKATLPVQNVFWQFLWSVNNAIVWTVRQEHFAQTIMMPYEVSKLIRAQDRFFTGNPNPAYTILVRPVAPSGTQLQFTNMGGLWIDTN